MKLDGLEGTLRAVLRRIWEQVSRLEALMGGPIRVEVCGLARDRSCIEDLVAYMRSELTRITQRWVSYRVRSTRLALHDAAQALRRLGKVPQVERYLREGSGRQDWPALAAVCSCLCSELEVQIDEAPDLLGAT